MANETPIPIAGSGFGPNEWIVDEIYEQFKKDKNLVDPAWWEFFNDYQPQEKVISKPQEATVTPISPVQTITELETPTPPPIAVTTAEPKESITEPLKGVAARVVTNMEASLQVPTA